MPFWKRNQDDDQETPEQDDQEPREIEDYEIPVYDDLPYPNSPEYQDMAIKLAQERNKNK